MGVIDWLEKVGREYRKHVREAYEEISGEDWEDFLGDDKDA